MSLTNIQKKLIIDIDHSVNEIIFNSGKDKDLLEYAAHLLKNDKFKRILDSVDEGELDAFYDRYTGFHVIMKLLDQLAEYASQGIMPDADELLSHWRENGFSPAERQVDPIIDELIIMLNEKIANRDLNTFTRGHLFDGWYFWQKIHYNFIGFKLTYSKNDTTLTNWDCAIILKRELKKINPLADITVEVISGDNDNNMVLINIGLREDGKPFEQTYVY